MHIDRKTMDNFIQVRNSHKRVVIYIKASCDSVKSGAPLGLQLTRTLTATPVYRLLSHRMACGPFNDLPTRLTQLKIRGLAQRHRELKASAATSAAA